MQAPEYLTETVACESDILILGEELLEQLGKAEIRQR